MRSFGHRTTHGDTKLLVHHGNNNVYHNLQCKTTKMGLSARARYIIYIYIYMYVCVCNECYPSNWRVQMLF